MDSNSFQEALSLVNEAKYNLEAATRWLASARSWGVFDLLWGGRFSTLIKHDKIDKADECTNEAVAQLRKAHQILSGVSLDAGLPEATLSDTLRFIDLHYDDAFADFKAQRQIKLRQKQVEQLLLSTYELRNRLNALSNP